MLSEGHGLKHAPAFAVLFWQVKRSEEDGILSKNRLALSWKCPFSFLCTQESLT
jgi:hypothetical protein